MEYNDIIHCNWVVHCIAFAFSGVISIALILYYYRELFSKELVLNKLKNKIMDAKTEGRLVERMDKIEQDIVGMKIGIAQLKTQMLFVIPIVTIICNIAIQKLLL